MPIYDRRTPTDPQIIDRFENGIGWIAHPDETGRRASHAIRGPDGVWLIDPLDAPGIDDHIAGLGEVAGVAVLSGYHTRDASAIADRHGVSVHVPQWLDRTANRVPAPVERCGWSLGESGFALKRYTPFPGWRGTIAYRESDRTLYVPDCLGTTPLFTVGAEQIGIFLLCRLVPPRIILSGIEPERILVGHGSGLFEDAKAALADALRGSRRRFPAAVATNGSTQLRVAIEAFRD